MVSIFFSTAEAEPNLLKVLDGDTFEFDLNGDGRLNLPAERIRLLYVDTPELHQSHKGKNLKDGLPAHQFLSNALEQARHNGALRIEAHGTDRYGRTLALVYAGQQLLSLDLIREGHSYFLTRFGIPSTLAEYCRYSLAEAEAFAENKGIWKDSRNDYLKRLQDEAKTPRSSHNRLFTRGVHSADDDLSQFVGTFVTLVGSGHGWRRYGNDWGEFKLGKLTVRYPLWKDLLPQNYTQKPEELLYADGFLIKYRGQLELKLHSAWDVPDEQRMPECSN